MPTIFIAGKPLVITRELTTEIQQQIEQQSLIWLRDPDPAKVGDLLDALPEASLAGYVWQSQAADDLWNQVMDHYTHWQAAGGLVTNPAGEILLMFRRGKWDLPKGKIDRGETPEEAALREVTEETGLHHIAIIRKLTDTWHVYPLNEQKILKQTHWFAMGFTGEELTIPQIEEDIVDIQWIRPENIGKYMPYSYPNLQIVFRAGGYLT